MRPSTAAALILPVVAACVSACGPKLAEPAPNIVIVISDDHGYPDFGFMGSEVARTPNLDRLARGGFVFTQGYSAANKCRPSLNAILTGLYPLQWDLHRNDVLANSKLGPIGIRAIIRSVDTLPRRLAERGYASFQSGKYWEGHPTFAGFSSGTGRDSSIGRTTLEPVFEFLEEHRDQPFLLWYAPKLTHTAQRARSLRCLVRRQPLETSTQSVPGERLVVRCRCGSTRRAFGVTRTPRANPDRIVVG